MAQLKYRFENIEVQYNTYGHYSPATHYEPPEYPEHVFEAIYYKEVDILPILSEKDQEEIYELLLDHLY
jgi:hypothetical protein